MLEKLPDFDALPPDVWGLRVELQAPPPCDVDAANLVRLEGQARPRFDVAAPDACRDAGGVWRSFQKIPPRLVGRFRCQTTADRNRS